jgi:glutathione-regulated potassium-efflux system protein KefB
MKGNMPVPTPLAPPKRPGQALNEEAAVLLGGKPATAE